MLIHREALELARNAASHDTEGVPITISCVKIGPDGSVTVTDGHHWLRMKAAADEPNLFDELAERGTDALEHPVLVPADVIAAFNAAMKKRKVKKGQPVPHVVVAQHENRITLKSSDGKTMRTFELDAPDAELKFPDVDKTVQAHLPTHHVVLSVDLLALLVKTLRACKATTLKLGFPIDTDAPVTLSTFTLTGPIDGAIMPMRE